MISIDRELLTQALIALGACIGGWMVFVQPKSTELTQLKNTVEELRERSAELSHLSVDVIAGLAPNLKARSDAIEAKGRLAQDSSLLYGRIMSLAQQHDIQVKNLRPGAEHKGGRDKTMIVTRLDMTAEGEFEQIAKFLEALDGIGTYIRATSVQIAPTKRRGGSNTVLQLGFETLRFGLPKAVTDVRG